jgi:hypothetical protein
MAIRRHTLTITVTLDLVDGGLEARVGARACGHYQASVDPIRAAIMPHLDAMALAVQDAIGVESGGPPIDITPSPGGSRTRYGGRA